MDVILKYFPDLNELQKKQFKQLESLYKEWNTKINVISRKDIDELYERHVLHSLAIGKFIRFEPQTTILDIGTGGGFPGIPLAILFPEVQFYLADSIGKKIKVVQGVTNALGLKNVQCEHIRAEKINLKFDFIISRAVTNLSSFKNWIKGKVKTKSNHSLKNGVLYLKGGDLTEEIKASGLNCQLFPLKEKFTEEFFETKYLLYWKVKK